MSENGKLICIGKMELSNDDKTAISMLKTKKTTAYLDGGFTKFINWTRKWMKDRKESYTLSNDRIARNIKKILFHDQIYYLVVSTTRKETSDSSVIFTVPSLNPVIDIIKENNEKCNIFRVFVFDTDNEIRSENIRAIKIETDSENNPKDIDFKENDSTKQNWKSYPGKNVTDNEDGFIRYKFEDIWT